MVKVLLGSLTADYGAVELSGAGGEGLVYDGPDLEKLRALVEYQREWYDRSGVRHVLTDEELVRSLPYRLQGSFWAVLVNEETGLTQNQPPYDPWGNLWRRG